MALPLLGSPRRVAFARLVAASLGGFMALGAAYAIVPPLVTERLGGDDVMVGWTITVFALAALGFRLVAGTGIDRRGPRLVIGAGFVMLAAGGALFYVADVAWILFVARVLQGFGQALVFTAGLAWAIALAPASRRGQAISLFGLAIWAGLSIGPVAAQFLLDHVGFAAAELLLVLAPLAALAGLAGIMHPAGHGAAAPGISIPREALRPGLGLAFGGVVMAAIVGFAVLTFDDRGGGGGSYVIGAFGAATFLGRIALGHLPDTLGAIRTGLMAFGLALVGIILIGLSPIWWLAVGGAVICGAAWALLFPALALLAIDRTPPERRGAALAVYTGGFDVGFAVAGPLLGFAAHQAGYGAVYGVGAAFAVAGIALVIMSRRPPAAPAPA
jgi:MFS family permease